MGATTVHAGRTTADVQGDVVVFLIGMRINRLSAPRSWVPVFRAMPRMLRELARDEDSGLLGYRLTGLPPREFAVTQYWESREKLYAYAADAEREHRPAWAEFNRRARNGAGHVGIWHETYVVPAERCDTLYSDMPAYGLGAAHGVRPLTKRGAARR
ncbi:DUF4188 domain-containing protein [Streptomyces sp. HNM0574]|uniref:DUF4188 domain-containing protein n=1 Tax=Streptomyces sp. HNM0574 TaxID=2714954 RepID=UPI00146CE645|nr:DUF4188 domain-containing protein [Streptomyces sp. HNM0574]NLU69795.1 DUF4188 domain-containing protein [Streptomyces sp. HNM0574]